jgi:hypothetical protein
MIVRTAGYYLAFGRGGQGDSACNARHNPKALTSPWWSRCWALTTTYRNSVRASVAERTEEYLKARKEPANKLRRVK